MLQVYERSGCPPVGLHPGGLNGLSRCTELDDILEEESSIEEDGDASDAGGSGSDGGYLAASPDPNSPDSSFRLSGRKLMHTVSFFTHLCNNKNNFRGIIVIYVNSS